MTFNKIEQNINAIKEISQDIGNDLHEQYHKASCSRWLKEDLRDFILSDNDVTETFNVSEDDLLFPDIRNIQHAIIGFFGE